MNACPQDYSRVCLTLTSGLDSPQPQPTALPSTSVESLAPLACPLGPLSQSGVARSRRTGCGYHRSLMLQSPASSSEPFPFRAFLRGPQNKSLPELCLRNPHPHLQSLTPDFLERSLKAQVKVSSGSETLLPDALNS